jgi:glyoxylase-like metal-dependent hydrolase (beta-lactamase superfamily II)
VLEGSGGNVAVLTGPDGKLVVDSGIAVSRPQMETALSALGPQPVTHLINTHWHFDHANGNEWLHELGPEIIAHQNTPRHLATTQRVEDWSTDFRPLSKAALPTVLFDESVSTEVLVALPLFLLVTLLVLPFAKGAVIGFA